jgi:EAL domain-containing protein (putative c-di-GMP-specific phosphodiesterase class I)/ActR/RegA family two-component response regulator
MGEQRLFVVTSDKATAASIARLCKKQGFELLTVRDEDQFRAGVRQSGIDLVILDLDDDAFDGLRLLHSLRLSNIDAPVMLLSECDARTLEAALRVGVQRGLSMGPALTKPLDDVRLTRSVLESLQLDDPDISPNDIHNAIKNGELHLNYQPIVDVKTGALNSVEALLRWQHPQYGALNPELVVGLAEVNDLIGPLTQWVLRNALNDFCEWRRQGWDFSVAVNVSAPLLLDQDFAEQVVAMLEELGVPAGALVLEITESESITERVEVLETLTRLRLAGIELAIDDFGTGYSSLGRLHRMPFNELKIDKSFVIDTKDSARAEIVVRTIADLGHNLDMSVVAEGVASREAWDVVSQLGCDLAQGYFISRPIPAEQLTEWLHRWDVPTTAGKGLPIQGGTRQDVPSAADRPAAKQVKLATSSKSNKASGKPVGRKRAVAKAPSGQRKPTR